jgi:hypothetical protein
MIVSLVSLACYRKEEKCQNLEFSEILIVRAMQKPVPVIAWALQQLKDSSVLMILPKGLDRIKHD